MLFHELALAASRIAAWAHARADAAAAAEHRRIVSPILERLIPMTVDVSKLVADFATFRGDLTTTLADAHAKMDELQALKLSDADAQAKIDALDASLGELETQVKPAAPVVAADPAPVTTADLATTPATDPTATTADAPAAVDLAPQPDAPAADPAAAPALQQDTQVSLTA